MKKDDLSREEKMKRINLDWDFWAEIDDIKLDLTDEQANEILSIFLEFHDRVVEDENQRCKKIANDVFFKTHDDLLKSWKEILQKLGDKE